MSSPTKRGRPSLIDDAALGQRFSRLLDTLQGQWSSFAWELQRAKNLKVLRESLQPIRERPGLELFVLESPQTTTLSELKQSRIIVNAMSKRLGAVNQDERLEKERLDRVTGTLGDSGPNEELERVRVERQVTYAASVELLRQFHVQLEERIEDLRRREAHFSQSQVLNFIVSKRYTFGPLTLAHAMAGLPYVTWRQSTARCLALTANPSVGLSFQMFQEVLRALANPPQTSIKAIEQVKAFLLLHKNKGKHSVGKLRADWYYLRCSIEAAYSEKPLRKAIPYRVFAEYNRRSSLRTRYDQVMEDEEHL